MMQHQLNLNKMLMNEILKYLMKMNYYCYNLHLFPKINYHCYYYHLNSMDLGNIHLL